MITKELGHLQIIPYPGTESAIEKQMPLVFKSELMAQHAIMIVSYMSVPSKEHIFCVDPVLHNQPSKELVF
jgi:hypothetical protein